VLDRGYFSKDNIYYLEENGYSFIMMLKGKADLVQRWILENKGSFETSRVCNIPAYQIYGKTIEKKLFASDKKPRYIHLYHSTDLEAQECGEVEKKINQLTTLLNGHINQFREFGPGMETYFELYYDENAKKREKKGEQDKQGQNARKFVFFEEKIAVIELELRLCGYFCIITSDKMTAKQALEIYKGRDASEKLFLSDKTFLGNHALRSSTEESAASKIFIEFVALIIRNRIYTKLKEEAAKLDSVPNFMTVPAAPKELDKIEMVKGFDRIYRIDHAVTKTQKTILKAFGMDEMTVKERAKRISEQLKNAD
jgi:transposase